MKNVLPRKKTQIDSFTKVFAYKLDLEKYIEQKKDL